MSNILEVTYQLEDLNKIAEQVLAAVNSKVILFNGPMGSGKTTLIKALCKALGSVDEVSSPTFSLVNEYAIPGDKIYHFDLYRLEEEDEALQFGFEEYVFSPNWVFIEWPEKVKNLLPDDVNCVEIDIIDERSRSLKLSQNVLLTQIKAMEQQKF